MEAPDTTAPPEPVLNLERVRLVPYVVAVLLALLGVLTLPLAVHVGSSTPTRSGGARHLGAELSWTRRVVHWQATVLAIAPVLVGVPVGLIIGRRVFTWLARSLGVADDPSSPVVILVGLVVALIGLANVTAAIPARRAARLAIADQLRVE